MSLSFLRVLKSISPAKDTPIYPIFLGSPSGRATTGLQAPLCKLEREMPLLPMAAAGGGETASSAHAPSGSPEQTAPEERDLPFLPGEMEAQRGACSHSRSESVKAKAETQPRSCHPPAGGGRVSFPGCRAGSQRGFLLPPSLFLVHTSHVKEGLLFCVLMKDNDKK